MKRLGFRKLNGKLVLILIIPILYDVFSQVVGLRDSNGFWRSVTGALAVFAIAGWFYPLLDADFEKALATIARKQARREREALASARRPSLQTDYSRRNEIGLSEAASTQTVASAQRRGVSGERRTVAR